MKVFFVRSLLFLGLLLTACGAKSASTDINVTFTDFQFTPNTFTIPAGKEISFSAVNNGSVVHNFVIMKLGTDAGPMFEDDDEPNVYWQVEVVPGSDVKTTFTAPSEPGVYQVVCRTEGHIASGMVATLNVVANK